MPGSNQVVIYPADDDSAAPGQSVRPERANVVAGREGERLTRPCL